MSDVDTNLDSSQPPAIYWQSPQGLGVPAPHVIPTAPTAGVRNQRRSAVMLAAACAAAPVLVWLGWQLQTRHSARPESLLTAHAVDHVVDEEPAPEPSPPEGEGSGAGAGADDPRVMLAGDVERASPPSPAIHETPAVAAAMRPRTGSQSRRPQTAAVVPVRAATPPGQVVDRRTEHERAIQAACGYTVAAGETTRVAIRFRVAGNVVVDASLVRDDGGSTSRCAHDVALRALTPTWRVTDPDGSKQYNFVVEGTEGL